MMKRSKTSLKNCKNFDSILVFKSVQTFPFVSFSLDEDIIYDPLDEDIKSEFLKGDEEEEEDQLFEQELPSKEEPEPEMDDSDDDFDDDMIPEGDAAAEQ
jgi:hypothetical protein